MRTLAQSRQANAQELARVLAKEARLQAKEAAEKNRRLYQVGGLVDRAGLLELDDETLLGMLLSNKAELVAKSGIRARWQEAGAKAMTPADEGKEAVVVGFPAETKITRQLAMALREVGLRENRIRREWEGRVDYQKAASVVEANGGTIRRLSGESSPRLVEAAE